MRVGFIAYDNNHLKSDQVLTQWGAFASEKTRKKSTVFLVPFASRKARAPVFEHRPRQAVGGHPGRIARSLDIRTERCDATENIPDGMDIYVVLGVGLLPDAFVERNWVINAHPGLIPYSRGLDSFKWAIYTQHQVGVTLHRLSPEVDMGAVWVKVPTPVVRGDSLESFARRHYELEIAVLSRFDGFVGSEPKPVRREEAVAQTRRMPAEKEYELWAAFDRYKERYGG